MRRKGMGRGHPREAPRKKRVWTKDEEEQLQDQWGCKSIKTIAKNLGRSEDAVISRARLLELGPHLESDHRISLNQLMIHLLGTASGESYTRDRLIKAGLPVERHKVRDNTYMVVNMDDFWRWAEDNKDLMDFSRMEPYIFGAEPEWVKEKRKIDYDVRMRNGAHNQEWTRAEDTKLRRLLARHEYTYKELAAMLQHSEGAVKRRISTLGIKDRPVKAKSKPWSKAEEDKLLQLKEKGYDFCQISDELGRSALACRGKYERLLNPEYMRRYYRGTGAYDYVGIKEVKAKQLIEERRAAEGNFYEDAPPDRAERRYQWQK